MELNLSENLYVAQSNDELTIGGAPLIQVSCSAQPANKLSKFLRRWLRFDIRITWVEMTNEMLRIYLDECRNHGTNR